MGEMAQALRLDVARRDLILAGAGAIAEGIAVNRPVLAQSAPPPSLANVGPGMVDVERRGTVLLIGINRPQVQNRMDAPIIIGLGKAFYQFEYDDTLRVAVLHGVGADFCMGVDLAAFFAAVKAGILPPKDPEYITPLALRPPFRSKPVVVAVQGGVNAAGHELVLASDIRVAANDTVFTQPEVTRGIFPGGGATIRFTREAGWGNAMRYMLTGDKWGADEAHRMGIVQEVTAPGRQLDRAVELAGKIALAAPLGVHATLASAHQAISNEDAALQSLGPDFQHILQSEDAQEGQRAFRENRAPVFRGQ